MKLTEEKGSMVKFDERGSFATTGTNSKKNWADAKNNRGALDWGDAGWRKKHEERT